jgi:hypothetical protein
MENDGNGVIGARTCRRACALYPGAPDLARYSRMPGGSPFSGMDLDVIDTGVSPPSGWSDWIIPVDNHPDARVHSCVAQLVSRELERIMKATPPLGAALLATVPEKR